MKNFVKEYTLKKRLMNLLLFCLDWGSSVRRNENYEINIQRKLKVQYNFDPRRIRSCIDLIEDTEEAILSFSKYGIEKFSFKKNSDFGEKYLRLYGILNAIQQQRLAIIELYETLRLSTKKAIKKEMGSLKIVEIRNIVGAHTINLVDNGSHKSNEIKTNFFRITQANLTNKAEDIVAVDGFQNIHKFNIYESCLEYNRVSEKILYDGIINYANRIFKNAENRKIELLNHYNLQSFWNYNYETLYENDKLLQKSLKSRFYKINKEMTNELGADWKTKVNKDFH